MWRSSPPHPAESSAGVLVSSLLQPALRSRGRRQPACLNWAAGRHEVLGLGGLEPHEEEGLQHPWHSPSPLRGGPPGTPSKAVSLRLSEGRFFAVPGIRQTQVMSSACGRVGLWIILSLEMSPQNAAHQPFSSCFCLAAAYLLLPLAFMSSDYRFVHQLCAGLTMPTFSSSCTLLEISSCPPGVYTA